ncbi:MAG TPA: class I SAM-dependent methyltransferase [Verrucomicrobiae bacterium]|nr:class I SAM-dependent methyltransferase [Verrucomicrobiae bacterium]
MFEKDFSHGHKFTGYMEVVTRLIQNAQPGQKVLDIPAGNGRLAAHLREHGHDAVCADINQAGPDYVYADMNQRLPFADASFDTVTCMEGIEHVLDPTALIAELCRITRKGGRIILTLPNIQCVYSRLYFLCTGCFYQFVPWNHRVLQPGEKRDRGHIASLSYLQLNYLFQHHGARLLHLAGDRWKKKWLIPFLLPFIGLGWIGMRVGLSRQKEVPADQCRGKIKDLFSAPLLFSRSLILVFEKF